MHPDLHRYLDGEISRDALPPELRGEADEWESLTAAATLMRAERAPFDLENRIMAALPAAAPAPAWKRALEWLVQPRPIQIRPIGLIGGLSAAALAAVMMLPGGDPVTPMQPLTAGVETDDPNAVVYVQFVYAAADANSVRVAGDFNGWRTDDRGSLSDADGDGVWTGMIAVEPGLHKYMFVVDGEEWVTDPRAERYVDDGFGMQNALIAVTLPETDAASS